MNDSDERDTEANQAVGKLTTTLDRIKVTEGISDVLDETQLEEVDYAAVELSAAVIEYLARAITHFDKSKGERFLLMI